MPNEIEELIAKFKEYIHSTGHEHPSFYVGVSENALERLEDHKVNLQNGSWSRGEAFNSEAAEQVVRHIVDLGCEGGRGDETGGEVYIRSLLLLASY